jgi:hypothetical protein
LAVDDEVARRWLSAVHAWTRYPHADRRVDEREPAPGLGWNYYAVVVDQDDGVSGSS